MTFLSRPFPHPLLRWVGGKGQLLHEILPLLPDKPRFYVEPFLGGGAVFFALMCRETRPQLCLLSDFNGHLVSLYNEIRNNVEAVIEAHETLVSEYEMAPGRETYARMVMEFNDPVSQVSNPARMAALFLVLNRTCFNGVYRVTKTGKFNAPWGLNSKLKFRSPETIRDASWAFKDALVRQGSAMSVLRDLMPTLGPEDLVYLDPPYVPLDNKDSFLDYTSVGFGLEQQKELAELFKELASRGVCVVASNSDTPTTRKLYKGWAGKQVWAHRKVNANKLERGVVAELLVFSQRGSILDTPPPEVKQWPANVPDILSKDTLLTDIFSDSDLILPRVKLLSVSRP